MSDNHGHFLKTLPERQREDLISRADLSIETRKKSY